MKMLIGYNGSESAKAALELVAEHAKIFKADVVIVSSVEGGTITREVEIRNSKENLDFAKNFIAAAGLSAETYLLFRGYKPGEDIVKFAKENNIKLIFIGIVKRSKVDKMIFGSNAQYIILNAHCPVVTVK
jgi:nucleotide-binding universal stress UspA family protein